MCSPIDIPCHFMAGAKLFAETAFETILEFFSDAIIDTLTEVITSLGTFWVDIDTPSLTGAPGGSSVNAGQQAPGSENIVTLMEYGIWIALGVCVLSLIALGARMGLAHRRGEGADYLGKIGLVLVAVVLISAASAIVLAVMPSSAATAGSGATVFLQNSLWWYAGGAAIMSVIIGAAKMAWEQRAEPGKELLKSLLTLAVVSAGAVTLANLAIVAADDFSKWIIDNSTNGTDFGENIAILLVVTGSAGLVAPIVPLTMIVLGLVAIIASALQIVLMVVRIGMLVILTGILPLAASFTNTEMGKSWFKKCLGWLIAFILYKPAAAIIYAAAFQLVGADLFGQNDGVLQFLAGLTLMVVALIAMPALIRFTVPMVGGMAAGAGAGAAAAGAMADLPSGAAKTSSDMGGGGGGGGGGSGGGGGGGGGGPSGAANTSGAGQSAGQSAGQTAGQGAAQGGQAAAGGAAKAGATAGAGAATMGVGAAVMAAAETAKKAGEAVAKTVKETAEGSESGGEGPSGSG